LTKSIIISAVIGDFSEDFITIVHPAQIAGASFHACIIYSQDPTKPHISGWWKTMRQHCKWGANVLTIGKFHGMIWPQTPTGSLVW
jgi:hypothetical protein